MSPEIIGLIGFGGFFLLLATGMPIALAAAAVGFGGLMLIGGWDRALYYIGVSPYSEISIYEYSVLPLFIIMGDFFDGGGYIKSLFSAAVKWAGNIPGGLAIGTILGGAAFAAASGSSVASAAILGKVCVPEMQKYGYKTAFAAAVACVSGCLAAVIPPSVLMVIFGIITGVSIGKLLIAGIIPGLLLAAIYIVTVLFLVMRNPSLAPRTKQNVSWADRFKSLKGLWALIVLVLVIMVGLYTGVFTPTEAGAVGALCALLMGLINRKLSWINFRGALLDAGKSTAFILFIMVGIMLFTRFLAQGGVPSALGSFLTTLPVPPWVILSMMIIAYIFLGCFMNAPSMLVLTLPIFFPVITSLGYDPIVFGIVVVILCEIGMLTPPVGMNVFVVKGIIPGVSLEQIFRMVTPFVIMSLVFLVLLIIFPQITLFLPSHMITK